MSPQLQFMAELIYTAKQGLPTAPGALQTLRNICRKAADAAPDEDLIRMAEFLCALGKTDTRPEEGN